MSVKLQMRDDSFFFFYFMNNFCKIIDVIQSLLCIFSSERVVKVSGRVLFFSYMLTVFYRKHVQNLSNESLPLMNISLQWSWWSSFCLSTIEMSVRPAWHGCKNNTWAKNSFQAWGWGLSSCLNGRVGFYRSFFKFFFSSLSCSKKKKTKKKQWQQRRKDVWLHDLQEWWQ